MKTIFDYMMNCTIILVILEKIVNIVLSPDFAKCPLYVIGIQIKWLI